MIFFDRKINPERIEKMGLLAVKIAQMFAMRIDVLSEEKCQQLSKLLTDADTAVPPENLDAIIDKYTDNGWRHHFSAIDKTPFATASVGQVHKATLTDGTVVAVKVIKTDFAEQFKTDVRTVQTLLRLATLVYPKLRHVADPQGILEDIRENTLNELDLRIEHRHQQRLADIQNSSPQAADLSRLHFPAIHTELSSEMIMVSDFISGETVSSLSADNQMSYEDMLDIFKIHGYYIFGVGTFHGDIHAGNIMLSDDKIYFVDTGAIATVPTYLRVGLFQFMAALSRYDYDSCVAALNDMARKQRLSGDNYEKYRQHFHRLYAEFADATVSDVSLTRQMMYTIKSGIEHGMRFERGMFPIIKSMMYLDAMVLNCNPSAKLLEDMRPLVAELMDICPELDQPITSFYEKN